MVRKLVLQFDQKDRQPPKGGGIYELMERREVAWTLLLHEYGIMFEFAEAPRGRHLVEGTYHARRNTYKAIEREIFDVAGHLCSDNGAPRHQKFSLLQAFKPLTRWLRMSRKRLKLVRFRSSVICCHGDCPRSGRGVQKLQHRAPEYVP